MSISRPRFALHLFSAAALSGVATLGLSAPANAAMTVECTSSSISCISFSGYSGRSVWNYPVNTTGNNCVNYAVYRLSKNGLANPGNLGNGGDWANRARAYGFPVDQRPAAGSIAQWNYGSRYAPSSGHVAYVEEVGPNGIIISESAWSGGSKRYWLSPGDPNWPSNFIHFKDVGYTPPVSGQFVRARETGAVYRMVGTAPVYVQSWAAFGGQQPTVNASSASIATLPAKVANGAFITGSGSGEVYRIVNGAPVYVSTWSVYGGQQPSTVVDSTSIYYAGMGGYYSRLNYYPTNVYVSAVDPRGVVNNYYMNQGTAYWLANWSQVGGVKPTTRIDYAALANAGGTGKWRHIRAVARY